MIVAEEGGFGKAKLLDAGAYKKMDACLMFVIFAAVDLRTLAQ
jgi:metal-dependent amidase/aminoacylase/carboxypeptidase family protein